MYFVRIFILICLLNLVMHSVFVCGQNTKDVETPQVNSLKTQVPAQFQTLTRAGLQNVYRVSDQLISGSGPEDRKSFQSLKNLGIKTIISVDGTKPNLKLAKEFGMRYVHIPIGYDGIPEKAGLSLTRVAKEIQGPIYIHCHHGRHRGPVAAAYVGLCQGNLNKKQAILLLGQAGTSKDYAGLWREVKLFQAPSPNLKLPELVESAQVRPLVAAMIQLSLHFAKLQKKQDWDIKGDEETLRTLKLLREEFYEVARLHASDYDEIFIKWMKQSEEHVKHLESAYKNRNQKQIDAELKILRSQCKRCHQDYRD